MTSEEELQVRARAESATLSGLIQLLAGNLVAQSGELAVTQARHAELVKAHEEKPKETKKK